MTKKLKLYLLIFFIIETSIFSYDVCLSNCGKQKKANQVSSMSSYLWLSDNSVRNMSPTPGKGFYVIPCIHPEGTEVVFHGGTKGYCRIWKYDVEKDTALPLTSDEYSSVLPSYSWDGGSVVFSSDSDYDQERLDTNELGKTVSWQYVTLGGSPEYLNIYMMNSNGSDIQRITQGKFLDFRASFSPDKKTIIFLSNRGGEPDGLPRLWSVNTDGSKDPKPILTEVGVGRPWYSVDGKWIFFFTDVKKRHTLCKMLLSGGEWEVISSDSVGLSSHGPFADPDGDHLWYHNKKDNRWRILRLSLKGGGPVEFIPPGFEGVSVAHPTRARNGNMTFDSPKLIVK